MQRPVARLFGEGEEPPAGKLAQKAAALVARPFLSTS